MTMMLNSVGTLVGVLASCSAVILWLYTFHRRFFISLNKTTKVCALGVYTTCQEALGTHFWFLIRDVIGCSVGPLFPSSSSSPPSQDDRAVGLLRQVEEAFHELFGSDQAGRVLVAHSCRSIFYYLIRALLNRNKRVKGRHAVRICVISLHFGGFYRLLRGMEKANPNCRIELYEIDLNESDWTIDQDSIDEEEFKQCDLLLCQNLFGLPLEHDKLIEMARRHNIPVVEDCVQSGSLYGKYKGSEHADVILYSGGLDKTPSCFGAGLGFFRDTRWGNDLFGDCTALHGVLPTETWNARLVSCLKIMIHVSIAKNSWGLINLLGLIAYVWVTERGDYINWYAISLKIRTAKAIVPFQHLESGFLRRPNVWQLQSILYGLSKGAEYGEIARREVRLRELLLSTIPTRYHSALFPWLTPEALALHRENLGVSEFSWVVSPIGDRLHLCQFLNDQFVVTMVNTTWDIHETTKLPVGRHITDNLIYLPNLNELDDGDVVKVGRALTLYCQQLEADGEKVFEVGKPKVV
jgi:DegT/DnrJ/EryC1/StrS aminotransferase family